MIRSVSCMPVMLAKSLCSRDVYKRQTAGNLYGTTYNGGAASAGVVFKLDTEGHETVLYNFTDGADGGHPMAGVILDSGDNLYGTTYAGGAIAAGAVYKLDTAGSETVLYGFPGGPDGASPYAGVIDRARSSTCRRISSSSSLAALPRLKIPPNRRFHSLKLICLSYAVASTRAMARATRRSVSYTHLDVYKRQGYDPVKLLDSVRGSVALH